MIKIVFLADYRHWAFDRIAHSIKRRLPNRFHAKIEYVSEKPILDPCNIDILYVFFWGETWYKQFGFERNQIIKEVASWRWLNEKQYGYLDPLEFTQLYLSDAKAITTPCRSIFYSISPYLNNVYHMPNGVEWRLFSGFTGSKCDTRDSMLRIGWAGNINDLCKGVDDIIIPASSGYKLELAGGSLNLYQLLQFYRKIDVFVIASTAESQPLTFLEALASGCYVVTSNVGIIPELNLMPSSVAICDRTVDSFHNALNWCSENLAYIRSSRADRSMEVRAQDWDLFAERFGEFFEIICCSKSYLDNSKFPYTYDRSITATNSILDTSDIKTYKVMVRTWMLASDAFLRFVFGDRFRQGASQWLTSRAYLFFARFMHILCLFSKSRPRLLGISRIRKMFS